ncbi:MAG TPA: transposase DNA-binding-containing protein, partial [Phycisphaerae bacterium]|nr:transposase DNA-binding-containing protein [Phycisphaerae bacterium]
MLRLRECPSGTLPSAITDLKDIKAAYRFLSNPDVSYEQVIQPHQQYTRDYTRQPGEYLLVEDTSELDFTEHWAAKGFGRIGNDGGAGLLLHTTLAVPVRGWTDNQPHVDIAGIWSQQCWARTEPPRRRETRRQLLQRPRESQKWARALADTDGPPPAVRWT